LKKVQYRSKRKVDKCGEKRGFPDSRSNFIRGMNSPASRKGDKEVKQKEGFNNY